MNNKVKTSVLFVCLGNICRSPTAQGVFANKIAQAGLSGQVLIDSAGTSNYHIGEPPDSRAIAYGARRGYDLSQLKARQVTVSDFSRFDYVFAMDKANLVKLNSLCPLNSKAKVQLLLNYSDHRDQLTQVPDPYYSDEQGFDYVLDLVENSCENLINEIRQLP
jgi:protein-tyrosine phosphatase